MEQVLHHLLFAAAWASFGIVHSLLAADGIKARAREEFKPFYRISYNVWAGFHLGAILLLEWGGFPAKTVFAWPSWLEWTLYGLHALGWILVVWAVSGYDLGRFAGIEEAAEEIRRRDAAIRRGRPRADLADPAVPPKPEIEPLRTSGLNAYMRHPLYTALLVVLWSRVFDEFQLATAIWGTAYIFIGTHFEERKLRRLYGQAYDRYRQAVPAFFPWRGRYRPGDD